MESVQIRYSEEIYAFRMMNHTYNLFFCVSMVNQMWMKRTFNVVESGDPNTTEWISLKAAREVKTLIDKFTKPEAYVVDDLNHLKRTARQGKIVVRRNVSRICDKDGWFQHCCKKCQKGSRDVSGQRGSCFLSVLTVKLKLKYEISANY
ncbi:uncharacterized protein [Rutidosis leptorrhynchoides]|uniref:uncharacterized protein isoform X2 n=1 Tax=Rutidosis leptorrhynchoides TaxID=125765 RepID=UPI003A994421